MYKRLFYIFLTFPLLIAAACSSNNSYPSVSSISGEWLEVKKEIFKLEKSEDYQTVLHNIDRFSITINNFNNSPVGKMFQSYKDEFISGELITALLNIDSLLERLTTAVKNSTGFVNAEILSYMLEVDALIELLQYNDANLTNTLLLYIYQLSIFLTLLIIIVILVIRLLYSRFEKMRTRERQSILFSRQIVNAQEDERKRIAREFHDTVAQDLWRLSFQIENEKIVEEQRAIIQRIRNICETLIPPDFQRRGLLNALKKLAFDFGRNTSIECRLTINKDINLELMDNDTQLQCFRIVQESLTNIEKHAQADEVLLIVRQTAGKSGLPPPPPITTKNNSLLISISDNGKGFLPPDYNSSLSLRAEGHIGLWGMYERAASISGTLTIVSDSEGTMINLQVPLERAT